LEHGPSNCCSNQRMMERMQEGKWRDTLACTRAQTLAHTQINTFSNSTHLNDSCTKRLVLLDLHHLEIHLQGTR
jgi:hypothetical protein